MILAYQIVMLVVIAIFTIASLGEQDKDDKKIYVGILIAAFISVLVSFIML